MKRRTCIILLILILLATALLRFYRLDAQSYWNDEGTSVALALRDLPTITENAANDIHPPLYYYLLHSWTSLFGSSETGTRSLSAVLGIFLVAALYALVKKFSSDGTALLATALAALNPLLIYYSQETRMYEMAALLGVLSMLALTRLFEAHKEKGQLPLGRSFLWLLVTALGVYTHYFVFAIVAAENVAVLIWLIAEQRHSKARFAWKTLLIWAAFQLGLIALYVPWLVFSWSSLSAWPSVSEPLSLWELARRVFGVYSLGVTAPDTTLWLGLSLLAALPALLGLVFKNRAVDKPTDLHNRLLAGAYVMVPILVMYGLSLRQPMYKPKFFIVAVPGFCWLQAAGITNTVQAIQAKSSKWLSGLAAILLLGMAITGPVLSLKNLYWDAAYARDDYRGIAEYIQAAATADSAVLINAPAQVETFDLYYTGEQPVYPLPEQRPLDEASTLASLQEIAANHDRIYAILWATGDSDPEGLIEGWLDENLYKTMDSWFGNVRLAVYAVPTASADEPEVAINAQVGNRFALNGYALTPETLTSGDIIQLTLFWQCTAETDTRYKTFVHLLDAQGNIIGQRDSEPVGGSRPTDGWSVGEMVIDNYGLLVPAASAPGQYSIRLGMYDGETGERLPVTLADGTTMDAILISSVEVALPETPAPLTALSIPTEDEVDWPGLSLVGHGLYRLGYEYLDELKLYSGAPLKLDLYWQRTAGSIDLDWQVQLVQGRETVWQTLVQILGGDLTLTDWPEGYTLQDTHVLYPPALEPGNYTVVLSGSDGQGVELQRIKISATP